MTYFFTSSGWETDLKPGDLFVYSTGLTLWDTTQTIVEQSVVERLVGGEVCTVLAVTGEPGRRDYVVLAPSQKYGWTTLARVFVQRV